MAWGPASAAAQGACAGCVVAGAGRAPLMVPAGTPLAGYGGMPRRLLLPDVLDRYPHAFWLKPGRSEHDGLAARALVLERDGTRVIWVAADLIAVDRAFTETVTIRLARKRTPSAIGYLVRSPDPLAESAQGVAISTFGKIIKRGWDWLGISPQASHRITGLVEAPDLAASLTLAKSDFVRSGSAGSAYLAYRKALQEIVS